MRAFAILWVLAVPITASAQDDASKCDDATADCTDNCSLKHGMVTRDAERAKLAKCLDKCKRADQACRDAYFEAKQTGLNPEVLKKDHPDDDLREDNKKKSDEPAPKKKSPETQPQPSTQAQTEKKAEPEKKKEDPPPAKKKKDKAIDEWDPEAL